MESSPPETPIATRRIPVAPQALHQALDLDLVHLGAALAPPRGVERHVGESLVLAVGEQPAEARQLQRHVDRAEPAELGLMALDRVAEAGLPQAVLREALEVDIAAT